MNLIVAAPGRIMFRAWGDANSWNMSLAIEPEPGQDEDLILVISLKLRRFSEQDLGDLYRLVLKDDG